MKYKVGDKVQIKSLDWYNENKTIHGDIWFDNAVFVGGQSLYCGCELTICLVTDDSYHVIENDYYWTDDMIEGLVEEEIKPEPKFKVGDKVILDPYPYVVTDVNWRDSLHGFIYTVRGFDFGKMVGEEDLVLDERTVPNTNEIIQLIKNDWNNFKDRYDIPDDYHFVDKNGNEINISEIVLEKKKQEYPKTYEECCEIIHSDPKFYVDTHLYSGTLETLYKLLICRDAYWKIAGDEMGLDKPWEPDWNTSEPKYVIACTSNGIEKQWETTYCKGFAFPTEEMRDAFYENFKELIETVKELL